MNDELDEKIPVGREAVFLSLLILFSGALVVLSVQMWMAHDTPDPPGMYPTLTSAGMLLCSLIALYQLLRSAHGRQTLREGPAWDRFRISIGAEVPFVVFVMMVAVTIYVVAIPLAGFYPATFVYMSFSIFFLFKGERSRLPLTLGVSAGVLLAVYLIIQRLFQVRMP